MSTKRPKPELSAHFIREKRILKAADSYKCCRGCCVTGPYYKDCEADAQKR